MRIRRRPSRRLAAAEAQTPLALRSRNAHLEQTVTTLTRDLTEAHRRLANGIDAVTAPKRIQLRRTKGWRKPDGAIVVARPTRWGNPYVVHSHQRCGAELDRCPLNEDQYPADSRADAVRRFEHMLRFPLDSDPPYPALDEIRYHLAGRDLACWCPADQPCHADVLLELANPTEAP